MQSEHDDTSIDSPSESEQTPRNPNPPSRDEPEDLPTPNEILGTLFEETSLWPLLIVLLGSLGAFGAAMLVLAIGDRNPFAAAALLLVSGMTIDLVIRARTRPQLRNLAKAIGLFWVVAISMAVAAAYAGIT